MIANSRGAESLVLGYASEITFGWHELIEVVQEPGKVMLYGILGTLAPLIARKIWNRAFPSKSKDSNHDSTNG